MYKSYYQFMNEISSDEIYEGLLAHGMFSEKLPPIFSSEQFFQFCNKQSKSFDQKPHRYVYYENMRNVNIPRPLAIPQPIAYLRQCEIIRDNWTQIKEYFKQKTKARSYKVSRIHIRKMHNSQALFQMNYDNWRVDGNPELILSMGKRYLVKADISTCFQSIYTHALVWALVGKEYAKQSKDSAEGKKAWYNQIDKKTSNTTNSETHGLLIGPHVSNLLSEIVLTAVDNELNKYCYVRAIDDYTCYTETYEEAQCFLNELGAALRKYDLSLNHKKTTIAELPIAATEQWTRKLNILKLDTPYGKTDFILVRAYLDCAIELMHSNGNNAAILNYAIKTLLGKELTDNAKEYVARTVLSYALIYPYLVTILDDYVFSVCCKNCDSYSCIKQFSSQLFKEGIVKHNYEQSAYALFFAIKYNFELLPIDASVIIKTEDCILLLLTYLYAKKYSITVVLDSLNQYALSIKDNVETFDEYWLFLYEILDVEELDKDWKRLKKAGISFIKKEL